MTPDDRDETDLRPMEADALRALQREEPPPTQLYGRVARDLRTRGLMRGRSWSTVPFVWTAVGLAAGLVIGVFGARNVESPAADSSPEAQGPSFALFMIASDSVRYPANLSEMDVVELYRSWAERLALSGRLSFGEELVPRRYAVDRTGPREVSANGAVDGMFVVRAPSADSAMTLAATLPHVQYGGTVMVQEIARR